ncbi:MAG: hypothetical protein QOE11_223 [Solirubrobacteraceae bacterium]|jgi:hypothetical protein|nr:hypothetical protein [Solirubrobacteraceae bacterium]
MDHHEDPASTTPPTRRRLRMPLAGKSPRTRSVVLATGLLVVGISPFAIAKTGSNLREGLRNGTAVRETQIISNVGSTTAPTGGYSTRQSNLSSSGGGAVYGCRSGAGGSAATPTPQNPCIRANNLAKGLAFEFNASNGDTAGLITVGAGGDATKPFTTNATGVATGLNSDQVDGLGAAQIIAAARAKTSLDADTLDGRNSTDFASPAPFAQVTTLGTTTAATSRGLIANNPIAHPAPGGVYDVTFLGDLSNCAVTATLTGGTLGEITATPAVTAGNTTVTVRTASSVGTLEDHPFNLVVDC